MNGKTLQTRPMVSNRMRAIRRVLWSVFLLNLAVAAAKYFYGIYTGSSSMQADGIHSVFDSAGNVVGLIGMAIAARPADATHPYGHSKFETYASLAIGILLLIAAFETGYTAIEKLISGVHIVEVTPISFVIMGITLLVNVGVTWYERRSAKRLQSEVLAADAGHTLSDALVSAGVIVGLVFVSLGFRIADPIMALIVTCVILYTAFDVFRHALRTLSDHARIPEGDISACVLTIPGVLNVHRIRTRGTEGEVYADFHVLVAADMTVSAAHDLSKQVEETVMESFPSIREVLVHIEPNDGHVD